MPANEPVAETQAQRTLLVLGIDTCGPMGSVALARFEGAGVAILGQIELAGRSYSATLVAAVAEVLTSHGAKLADVGAIVVVNGPGSFTGVRVGLSAVKGLAEPEQTPVVAISRLAVLAAKATVGAAALDAHRHEIFLRINEADGSMRELLAGAQELAGLELPPATIAVCDEQAAELLRSAYPEATLVWNEPPTAAEAIQLCLPRIRGQEFDDLALLDGHYLRRSDAEIFGDPTAAQARRP